MSTLQPSAEWIARRPRESPRDSSSSSSSSSSGAGCCSGNKIISPLTREAAGLDDEHDRHEEVVGHRGSGGLIRGRAVFCLPPGVHWFQGHFAYTAVGGCSASLGVLGTELPVDPCMQCCHGGFSRHKLVFIHHESGKESALIVERYGGNMMSLHAEPSVVGAGDGPVPPESELSFQTHVMKADDDARALLDRYFQSIVRAASDPTELQDCIVCIGQMDVPLSLLQELAAPLPDSRSQSSMVCSAFAPCREATPTPSSRSPQQEQQQQQQQQQQRRTHAKNTPSLSPYPHPHPHPHPPAVSPEEEKGEEKLEAPAGGDASAVTPTSPSSSSPSSSSPCGNGTAAAAAAVDAAADALALACSATLLQRDGDGGRDPGGGGGGGVDEGAVEEGTRTASLLGRETGSSSGGGGGDGGTSGGGGDGDAGAASGNVRGLEERAVVEGAKTEAISLSKAAKGDLEDREDDWLER